VIIVSEGSRKREKKNETHVFSIGSLTLPFTGREKRRERIEVSLRRLAKGGERRKPVGPTSI